MSTIPLLAAVWFVSVSALAGLFWLVIAEPDDPFDGFCPWCSGAGYGVHSEDVCGGAR